jgi:hypothetical protein
MPPARALALALAVRAASCARAGAGHIYSISENGTSNLAQFVDLDLSTWSIAVGPPLAGRFFGQASAVAAGLYWAESFPGGRARALVGVSPATRAVAASLDMAAWPGGGPLFLDSLFATASGGLLAVGSFGSAAPDVLAVYEVADPAGAAPAVVLRGNASCAGYCDDGAYDPARELLFFTSGRTDAAAGSLVVLSLAGGGAPAFVREQPLADDFGFSQWDAATRSLFGLTLAAAAGGDARNVTVLADPGAGTAPPVSRGAIGGGLYVVLEDGPKAFDAATRRAFSMLANGPFGEFDVVAVDVDASPPRVLETPGLCGFIGYCPQAFAFAEGV